MKRPFSPGWTVSGMKLVPCNQPPSESDATGPDQLFEEKSKNFSRPALLGGCAHVVETIYLCWFFPRGYHTSLYSNNVAVFWLHDQVWSSLMLVCFLYGLFIAYTKRMNRTHDPNDCRKAKRLNPRSESRFRRLNHTNIVKTNGISSTKRSMHSGKTWQVAKRDSAELIQHWCQVGQDSIIVRMETAVVHHCSQSDISPVLEYICLPSYHAVIPLKKVL